MSSRVIFLNSKDRASGSVHDYEIDTTGLTDSFFQLQDDEIMLVKPLSFAVLNDYNNINVYNRTFELLIQDPSLVITTYEVSLETGIYTAFTLQTELQTQIQSVLTSNGIPLTIEITFDDDKLHYLFSFKSSIPNFFDDNDLTFNFVSEETTPAQLMGFQEGEYSSLTTGGDTLVIESGEAVDMVFQPEIQVHCNLVSNNYESTLSSAKSSDILFNTYSQIKNSWIQYENQSNAFETECLRAFGSIEVRYTDNLNRPILFQSNSRLALSFRKVKMSNKTEEIQIKNILQDLLDINKISILSKSFRNQAES